MTETNSFAEYRTVGITEPLRQGDVLERIADDGTAWNRNLLVITADCDFAHNKHHGRVTCVPLLTKDEYILELQMPKLRNKAITELTTSLQNALSKLGAPHLSLERLTDWPNEQSTEAILASLQISAEHCDAVGRMVDAIRDLGSSQPTVTEASNALVQARLQLSDKKATEQNLRKNIINYLQNVFKSTPGDALFLSAIAVDHEYGYFVYLRHLEQVWEPQITLGPSRKTVEYRRISRLQDSFTHAIAQRFGLVFTAIGLPDEYEEMRNLHSDLIGEGIQ